MRHVTSLYILCTFLLTYFSYFFRCYSEMAKDSQVHDSHKPTLSSFYFDLKLIN